MKNLFIATIVLMSTSFLFLSHSHPIAGDHSSTATPEYVLKAWQIAGGDLDEWLWSVESNSDHGYSGILYKSLASPLLLERVSRFGAGTKLTLRWERGGRLDKGTDWSKELYNFRAFCESKGVRFDFSVVAN